MKVRKLPVTVDAHQWHKNGDHPDDNVQVYGNGSGQFVEGEGGIVRRYRAPEVYGERAHDPCKICERPYVLHGWINTLEGGHIVCPGDWIITGVLGEHYPCKPDAFALIYEPAEKEIPMTPITIEPNSGVKMAGVKVRAQEWKDLEWVEILFVGRESFMSVSENLWGLNRKWFLYEEPKPEVKTQTGIALCSFDNGKNWSNQGLMNSEEVEKARLSYGHLNVKLIWPAKFDMDGFLIIPEEFK